MINQEDINLIKQLLPLNSVQEILSAYSTYMFFDVFIWFLAICIGIYLGKLLGSKVKLEYEDTFLSGVISFTIGIFVFIIIGTLLEQLLKAVFPLGSLAHKLLG